MPSGAVSKPVSEPVSRSAPAPAGGWLIPALLGVLAITAARVALLWFNQTDLFVDEAQYWFWGQELAFGYYSKPPMIGWLIRAVTELAGSDAAHWVRLPGPILHGITALILGAVAARIAGPRAALVAALVYVTLPMVALGSLLISTDTVMFPFLAGALWTYLRLLRRPGLGWAAATGALLGMAFLAKYAAGYYILCALLAAAILTDARPGWRAAAGIALAFLIVIAPNLAWNLQNGLSTVQHTLDNADWVRDPAARAGVNLSGLAAFFAAQFAVVGPVIFAALMALALRWRRQGPATRVLLLFSLPILALVSVQALLAEAYANWAAAAYLAGTVAVVPALLAAPRAWLILSFAINGALSLAFPLASLRAETLTLGQPRPVLSRYIGRHEMSRAILEIARAEGARAIVAGDRDVLADLFYTGRNAGLPIHAVPPQGRAPHHYALKHPYRPGPGPVLLVLRAGAPAPCADRAQALTEIAPEIGAYRRHPQRLSLVPPDCFEN